MLEDAADVDVQLGSGGLVVEAAAEVEVWLVSGDLAVEAAMRRLIG